MARKGKDNKGNGNVLSNLFSGDEAPVNDVNDVAIVPDVPVVTPEVDVSTGWTSIKDASAYIGKSSAYTRQLAKYGPLVQRRAENRIEVEVASMDTWLADQAQKEAQKADDFTITADTQGKVDLTTIAKFYGVTTNSVRAWAKDGKLPTEKDLDSGRWYADAQAIFNHPKPAGGSAGAGGRGKTADGRTFYMLRLTADEVNELKEAGYGTDAHALQSRYAKKAKAAVVTETVDAPADA